MLMNSNLLKSEIRDLNFKSDHGTNYLNNLINKCGRNKNQGQ